MNTKRQVRNYLIELENKGLIKSERIDMKKNELNPKIYKIKERQT